MNRYSSLETYNLGLVTKSKDISKKVRAEMRKLGIAKGVITRTFRSGFGKDRYGEINRLSWHMDRALIYVHKGVGAGVPIAKAGSSGIKRKPKPFFNPILDKEFESIADLVAEQQADMVVGKIMIR